MIHQTVCVALVFDVSFLGQRVGRPLGPARRCLHVMLRIRQVVGWALSPYSSIEVSRFDPHSAL